MLPRESQISITDWSMQVPKRKPKLLKEVRSDSKPLPLPKKFVSFSVNDSRTIETAYQKLVEEEEDGETVQSNEVESPAASAGATSRRESRSINKTGQPEQRGGRVKVPVNEDYLFEVDIERRELAPVYWLGPIYEVRRGSWFYQEGSVLRPCEENLATQLEEGYLKVKPFRYPKFSEKSASRPASQKPGDEAKPLAVPLSRSATDSNDITPKTSVDNLRAEIQPALEDVASAAKEAAPYVPHEPQTHRLFGTYMNSVATYQDEIVAWLSSDGIMSRVSSTVYQRFAGGGYLGGVKLVRGYVGPDKANKATEAKPECPNISSISVTGKSSNPGLQLDERQQRLLKRRSAPPGTGLLLEPSESKLAENTLSESKSQEDALKRHISSMVIDAMDPERTEEAMRRRDENEIQHDYSDREGDDQSRRIDHLILVTHGIGQRLGMRYRSLKNNLPEFFDLFRM
jgi:hypothetical protein